MNIRALSWSILHGDMVVGGDVKALRWNIICLPDLQALPVGTEVGAKVDAVLGGGDVIGRDANLGASQVVYPLLVRIVRQILREADVAIGQNSKRVRHGSVVTPILQLTCQRSVRYRKRHCSLANIVQHHPRPT